MRCLKVLMITMVMLCSVSFLLAQQDITVSPDNKVTLQLRDVPRISALETLLRAAGKNYTFDPTARRFNDYVSINLQNVDFDQALKSLLGDYLVAEPIEGGYTIKMQTVAPAFGQQGAFQQFPWGVPSTTTPTGTTTPTATTGLPTNVTYDKVNLQYSSVYDILNVIYGGSYGGGYGGGYGGYGGGYSSGRSSYGGGYSSGRSSGRSSYGGGYSSGRSSGRSSYGGGYRNRY